MEVNGSFLGSSRSRGHSFHPFSILGVQIWSNVRLERTDLTDADIKYIKEGITPLEFIANFTVDWKDYAFA